MNLMNNLYIKRICPSCLQEFLPGDCDIVSRTTIDPNTNTNKVLKSAPKSGWQQRMARLYPETIKGKYILDLACRKCPNCGYLLPDNIEQAENLTIAIVGDTFSGKTHYIATLINHMKKGDMQHVNRFASLDCLTEKVENEYMRDVIKPLVEDKQSPAPNQRAVDANREPLIYELVLSPSPEHAPRRINLIFYDIAGEDLVIKERLVTFGRYVFSADAVIFIADPNSILGIYNELPEFLRKKSAVGRDNSAVLTAITNLLRRFRTGSSLNTLPIAITLSKADLLKQLLSVNHQYRFLQRPIYGGNLDLKDINTVDGEVRLLLENFGERLLLQSTQNFAKVKFFAVSATGYAPNEKGIYPRIDPCRCLDPFLWILYELKMIQALS